MSLKFPARIPVANLIPNPYEAPGGQETNQSYARVLPFWAADRVWRGRPSVAWADVMAMGRCQPSAAAPPTSGGSVATGVALAEHRWGSPLRPSNAAVPSCRPRHRGGEACAACQCASGAGEGQRTSAVCDARHGCRRQRGCPLNAEGSGRTRRRLPERSRPPSHRTAPAHPRRIPAGPGRRQAHPRCAPRPGGPCPYQRRSAVGACHRPPVPACEPGWARPSPWPVGSPSGPGLVAQRDGGAGTTRRPRNRPTCDARSQGLGLLGPRVGPRRPSPTGPAGQRRQTRARGGSEPCRGWPRAARG